MAKSAGIVFQISPGEITAVGAVFPALCIISVGLRFYTRRSQNAKLMVDDWLTIPALILTIALGVDILIGIQGHGLGYPTPGPPDLILQQTPENLLSLKVQSSFQLIQVPALALVKLSILFYYRRVFCSPLIHKDPFEIIIWFLVGVTIAWGVGFFFALLFKCGVDIVAQWGDVYGLITVCGERFFTVEYGFSMSDFIIDLFVIILPIPKIWMHNISLARKVAVTGIFVLGAIAVVASLLRLYITIISVQASFTEATDEDLEITEQLYWSMIESGVALVAACLPSLRLLPHMQTIIDYLSPMTLLQSLSSIFSLSFLRSNNTPTSSRELENAGESNIDERQRQQTEEAVNKNFHDSTAGETGRAGQEVGAYPLGDLEAQAGRSNAGAHIADVDIERGVIS